MRLFLSIVWLIISLSLISQDLMLDQQEGITVKQLSAADSKVYYFFDGVDLFSIPVNDSVLFTS
jgi:hypothetical protein